MKPLTKENVLEALSLVKDPDLGRDIVSLGFVKDLKVDGNSVSFNLELTTPACPAREEFRTVCVKAIRENIDGVGEVKMEMTSSVRTHQSQQREAIIGGVKNTIAVASGKGGVGKSTVAVSLAVSLSMDGARVGLIDCDVYGPSIPLMMGIDQRPELRDGKLIPLENYGVKLMSIGFLVDPMQAVIWRGPMASGAVKQFMSDVDWGELDYLVFDLPPGTGDVQLTLVQTIPLTGAVIVTTPQDISLADARKGLKMFERVNVPVFGIIENMSYFICSNCGHREEIFNYGGGKRTAEELGVPYLGEIPLDTKIRIGGDLGAPIVASEPDSPNAQIIRQIARQLAAQVSIRHLSKPGDEKVEISIGLPEK
jgi:ATP-binding protein involved in chromosome partitioning